jgi:hypothetical protein
MLELKPKEKNYGKYGFHCNPFPYVGVPNEKALLYANRRKELKEVEECIKTSSSGNSSHLILIASYGNGKTHTLKFIKKEIESQLEDVLPVYLATPGEKFLSIYSDFIYEIGLDNLERIVWNFLEFCSGTKNLRKKVNEGEILLAEILEIGKRRLFNEIKYTDFANSLLHITMEESKFLAWKYLCGEPIVHEQRREIDVVTCIDTDNKALRAFLSIKRILSLTGKQLICLCIDEFESIAYLHPLLKQKMLNNVRHLIDLCPSGLCLVIGCAPEIWVDIVRQYHAFSERIFKQITLKALDKKDFQAFFTTYLESYRKEGFESKSTIFPFTEDAIEEIHIAAEGNIRRALMICNSAIDKGLDNKIDEINSSVIKDIIAEL